MKKQPSSLQAQTDSSSFNDENLNNIEPLNKQDSSDNIESLLNSEQLKQYCLSFAGATEEYPFGNTPIVMKVSGKMFALIGSSVDAGITTISLKCDPFIGELLRAQYDAVKPGYHLNKRHWITVDVDGAVPDGELRDMIASSYHLIVKKLTKAEQAKLQLHN